MISKSEVLRRGVMQLLDENARERQALLKLVGITEPRESRKTALDVLASAKLPSDSQKPKYKAARPSPKRKERKVRHHKGLHWTQKPENRERVQELTRKAAATRAEAASK